MRLSVRALSASLLLAPAPVWAAEQGSAPPDTRLPTQAAPAGPAAEPPPEDEPPPAALSVAPLPPSSVPPPPIRPAASVPPPPYSPPWALRPIVPISVVRLDTTIAAFTRNDSAGVTVAIMPLVGYKLTPHLMALVRWGLIGHAPPETNLTGSVSVANPLFGGIYGVKLPAGLRLGLFLGITVPLGTGGYGDARTGAGDPNVAAATQGGLLARSAMDNVMFAVNDVSLVPGVDFAYVGHRLTVQIEVTLLQLMRVKNEATQIDAFRTNSTYGLHLGYFVARWLSLATELRYQRWLSTPAAVEADATGVLRHNLTLALGPRFHIKAPYGTFRPSLAYAASLLGVLARDSYHIVLIDLLNTF